VRFNEFPVKDLIKKALEEDAAGRDITTLDFIPEKARAEARITAGETGVACGLAIACDVFQTFDRRLNVLMKKRDGAGVKSGETLMILKGRARSVLSCERVALNFLGYLSGIATLTRRAVKAVGTSGVRILDTRKTTPLLRALEKYAVACGGGRNHRFDLAQQYLVKDNHLAVLKGTPGPGLLVQRRGDVPFEIEVEDLAELKKALVLCPDIIMLDNFKPQDVRAALGLLRRVFPGRTPRPLLELSGGITLANIRSYAIKGVDFISLGALTHSAPALDVSLEITKVF